ncbi:MAG: hypothetical protein H6Q77_1375 [Gemmatimonadetes bacterium]|nr:hypothetical protein [Gemmatimonadota bacterium]
MAYVRIVALVLAMVFAPVLAHAHETRPAYLRIQEIAPGRFSVLWRTPAIGGQPLSVVLQLPDGMTNLKPPLVQTLADSRVERRWIDAGPAGLAGQRIELLGLQYTITDVLVRVELLDGRSWTSIVRPARPWVEIAASQSSWQVAWTYVVEGIRHILFGPDHLLFVLGLMLIVQGRMMLLKTITAFTAAHSITLAMATLGYASLPLPPLEAGIALSILFLGPEIIRRERGETSLTIRYPWVIAFLFGLLHGFGFASGLSLAGIPRADIPVALLFFNVGVELGQLVFVFTALALATSFRALNVRWPRWATAVPGYVVGSLGAFWVIQRTVIVLGALR